MDFAEKIYKLRIEKGLSQQKLAEKAGLSQATIYYWEKGKRNPKYEQLQKIASALDVTITELSENDEMQELFLLEKLNKIKEEEQKWLKSLSDEEFFGDEFCKRSEFYSEEERKISDQLHNLKMKSLEKEYAQKKQNQAFLNKVDQFQQLLNDRGKNKALEQIELITKIPEYRKDPDPE